MRLADDMAADLLKRLIAGERDLVPLNLAMLLEKSARLDRGDVPQDVEEHYRRLLLPEIENLRISRQTREEVVATLCAEIFRNPDDAMISVCAITGDASAVKTLVRILATPSRVLTLWETAIALSHVTKWLPHYLRKDANFLLKSELEQLAHIVKELQKMEVGERDEDKSAQVTIAHFAPQLLTSLERIGIEEG